MQICGLNKTTLLDYPEHVAATIFLGRCNFRCPFCHNGDLVLMPEEQPFISKQDIFNFLEKRKGVLSGVCITGGEPTLDLELEDFIRKIKEIGYLVKLDTNGYKPEVLIDLGEKGLVDYVAMDIKNSFAHYAETVGIKNIDTGKIEESIRYLIDGKIPYEFRTTVVKELHTKEDMLAIGKGIKGAEVYFLQNYKESEQIIAPGMHPFQKEELEDYKTLLKPFVNKVELRGID